MYGSCIAKLQNSTPQQYHSAGGLGFENPAASENELFPQPSSAPQSLQNPTSSSPPDVLSSELINRSITPHNQGESEYPQNEEEAEHDAPQDRGESSNNDPQNEEAEHDAPQDQGESSNCDPQDEDESESNAPQDQGGHGTYDMQMLPFEPPTYAGQKRPDNTSRNSHQPSTELVLAEPEVGEQPQSEGSEERYDTPMLPFVVPDIAGQKRPHSPTPPLSPPQPMSITLRGRPVRRHDYKRLNSGRVAAPSQRYTDPKSWMEAMAGPDCHNWKIAAEAEFRSLISSGTAVIVDRHQVPRNCTVLSGKWVFKRKTHADGSLDKYKARWTARGFTQQKGSDYHDTFAPTPHADTTRLLFAVGHQLGWHRLQGDVPAAFLNPDLDVVLYILMPQGFEQKGKVIKLEKGLYGLKQAAALWHVVASAELRRQGLEPTESDVCLFTSKAKDLFVELHVDDFQILGPDKDKIVNLTKALKRKFNFKIVKSDQFLGIHLTHEGSNLKLSQGRYARELLSRHNLENCKPAATPLERRLEFSSQPISTKRLAEYNQIIGGLQYLANQTRPDISFATNHLSRFLKNPSEDHLIAAKRVLRYISNDPDAGIVFTKDKDPELKAFSDADFTGDLPTARSTTGLLIKLGGPISWKSRLQRDVVLSSTKAEYLALTETFRQVAWTRNLFEELELGNQIKGTRCTSILVDNQSAISLTKNHDNHRRSRHVNLRNHYCRQEYRRGLIDVQYVPTNKQQADSLTKPSSAVRII